MADIKKQLRKIIKGEVSATPKNIKKYSRDASLFEVEPKLVVFPKDSNDLKNLVKFVNKEKNLSLTARSAGTDMTGGPLSESIVIDFTRYFNRVKKIGNPSTGGYAVVQPGVYYRDFEKMTLRKNLLLPPYPASREICALGGMVANNAGGEKTLAYGKMEDYVEEIKAVLSDGNEYTLKPLTKSQLQKKMKKNDFEGKIYRRMWQLISKNKGLVKNAQPDVSKNSSGYLLWRIWDGKKFNLAKLFTGAQGTLGIITETKVKLVKPKQHSKLLVIFLNQTKPLAEIVNQVLKYNPESFEVFDDNTMKLGMRFLFWRFAFQFLPEIKLLLENNFHLPKLILLAEFTGDSQKEAEDKAQAAQKALAEFNLPNRITNSEKDTEKYWTVRRESFNFLRKKIKGKKTAPFIDDLVVQPGHLPEFLPKLEKILKKHTKGIDITYTIAGHIGNGNLHIIPLMDLANPKARAVIPPLTKEVYKLVFKFNGSMSAEHNDGLIRTPFMKQMFGSRVYNLFKEVKNIFDPDNIFNPGKKIAKGTPQQALKYAIAHLKKK